MRSAGIRPFLDHVIGIEEVQIFKPSPCVHELAPARLPVSPDALGSVSSNSGTSSPRSRRRSRCRASSHRGFPDCVSKACKPVATELPAYRMVPGTAVARFE